MVDDAMLWAADGTAPSTDPGDLFPRLWDPPSVDAATPSVWYSEETDLWLVRRAADIRRVLADVDTFRPDNALDAFTPLSVPALRTLARAGFSLPPTLANNGTETHAGLRGVVASFVTPRRVEAAVPTIRRLVRSWLDDAVPDLRGGAVLDLAVPLARDLPARVLLHLLRVEGVDLAVLKAWSSASLELFWGVPDERRQRDLAVLAGDFHRWLRGRLAAADPSGSDLFAALRRHRLPDGSPLSTPAAVGVCYFLFIAGQETTTQLLAGLLHRMLGEPRRWGEIAAGAPGAAEACVEEFLRLAPPVPTWRRITAAPTVIDGVTVPAGARLLLLLGAAGTDGATSPHAGCPVPSTVLEGRPLGSAGGVAAPPADETGRRGPVLRVEPAGPGEFHPGRPNPRRHLAFGHGPHFCLGANLARTEAAVVLRTVASALPRLRRVEDDPPQLRLLSFRAPRRVLVTEAPPKG
ncbi:cytochrome P450 [Actinoalloteichus hoggarensis]|uniref:cytochrome P450 n=1 Tax=Actinoalloteichus hoggarensis TaxID=1470176 RepID=UPI0012FD0CDE|nr:cytochrome P450 [Actinoalloteichus hoggarensis]MBB5920604.1 cytochrome P450 [Actinoalloteichus hoggarensis]